jgi:hypothetical protein
MNPKDQKRKLIASEWTTVDGVFPIYRPVTP